MTCIILGPDPASDRLPTAGTMALWKQTIEPDSLYRSQAVRFAGGQRRVCNPALLVGECGVALRHDAPLAPCVYVCVCVCV